MCASTAKRITKTRSIQTTLTPHMSRPTVQGYLQVFQIGNLIGQRLQFVFLQIQLPQFAQITDTMRKLL